MNDLDRDVADCFYIYQSIKGNVDDSIVFTVIYCTHIVDHIRAYHDISAAVGIRNNQFLQGICKAWILLSP